MLLYIVEPKRDVRKKSLNILSLAADLLKVSFSPHNEHSQFIYTAYDMHFDNGIEMASWRKENIQNQLMLWNKDWNLKGLLRFDAVSFKVLTEKGCRSILKRVVQHQGKQYH